ncbi:hypothetical protein BJ912DRAFT_928562 [Pholiota molesta]|nr:hypothetical protein BJ912DRAFT_928562 [Pholiota molesta]
MVDQTASLNTNIGVLIAAIDSLTAAVHENTRVCVAASRQHATHQTEAAPEPATQSTFPTSAFANLGPALTGDSPDEVRQRLSEMVPVLGPWYIVTVGSEPGVYQQPSVVQHLTSGVPGNSYKRYPSQDAALDAYAIAWSLGAIRRVR